jgi:hypothetical protein
VIFKKNFFTESKKNSRPRISSSRVVFFAENYFFYSRRRALRREPKVWLSPKSITLGEGSVSRSESSKGRLPLLHARAVGHGHGGAGQLRGGRRRPWRSPLTARAPPSLPELTTGAPLPRISGDAID